MASLIRLLKRFGIVNELSEFKCLFLGECPGELYGRLQFLEYEAITQSVSETKLSVSVEIY